MSDGHGAIFVSYRRTESRDIAGRLADRLVDRFGDDQVFLDVASLRPGDDFVEAVERAIRGCRAMLVVIGPTWASVRDERGRVRITDPDDVVAAEVRAALAAGIAVIPVLVDDARMPHSGELPNDLRPLVRRHAARLQHASFRSDVTSLIDVLAAVSPPRAAPKRPEAVIVLGESVRGVRLGANLGEVQRVFGEPPEVIRFPRNPGHTFTVRYRDQGLDLELVTHGVARFHLFAAGPAHPAAGGPDPGFSYGGFVGSTAQGISVSSTRAEVERAYGRAETLGAPILDAFAYYPTWGLGVTYATRAVEWVDAPVYCLTIGRPS